MTDIATRVGAEVSFVEYLQRKGVLGSPEQGSGLLAVASLGSEHSERDFYIGQNSDVAFISAKMVRHFQSIGFNHAAL